MDQARSGYPGSDEERRIVLRTMAHLSDDKAVAKMGHPIVVVLSDMGHPANSYRSTVHSGEEHVCFKVVYSCCTGIFMPDFILHAMLPGPGVDKRPDDMVAGYFDRPHVGRASTRESPSESKGPICVLRVGVE